ncbi:MAG: type II CRISPR RNA-guided endonuclease Cas9 [Thermoguttaceae bacterium]|nr:type II CRISPR RNA-guided endonuclease Cas9 [Thermoguttaceae bacterium]
MKDKAKIASVGASGGYTLGLDLGVGSIGWAAMFGDQLSNQTLRMGVRVFEAGTDGDLEKGKDESRNLKRRTKRQTRKGVKRTRRRIVKLFNVLKKAGLLPEGETSTPKARQDFLNRLDQELFAAYCPNAARVEKQTFLYALRARALDEKLTLCAVGRSILHLAVRRGFLSNKKITGAKSEQENKKEEGVVKNAISELDAETAAVGARTVGEYFAKLDPMKDGERIRGRYLGRKQIQAEFDAIWASQARFHPETLTAELRAAVWSAIFRQRPLKSQKGLIGRCEFEKTARRVEKGDPAFQEYRIWQRVLDLRLYDSPEAPETARPLTLEEQDKVAAFLGENESATFNKLRKTLGIKGVPDKDDKKATLWRFNFEVDGDGESKLFGNRTRAKIVAVLKEQNVAKNDAEIDKIAREILLFENAEALARRLRKMFPDFDEATAKKLSEVSLETTRANVSRRAAEKLTAAMKEAAMKEKRLPLQTVRQELYPNERNQTVFDFLPPVFDALGDPRNPVVLRALTELRKVVNALIRRWGKPALIRVELARDLKRGRKEREKIFFENNKRQKERERIQKTIKAICGREARPFEILKWRLWEECGGVCPYTGKSISERQLLSDESPIDVEHIIPLSCSLDDSFANKTLCWAEENRERKRNQTPFECYSAKPQWREILDRVRRFKGDMRQEKLKRFLQEKIDDDPSKRMLNDTRYISRLATKYLGALYGAVDGVEPSATDEKGTRRIQVSTGDATAWLRKKWKFPKKNRDDLRHHAVDALVVALVGPKEVQTLSKAAQAASELGLKRNFSNSEIAPPSTANGEAFLDVVARAVDRIVVSHRVDRKLSGALHDETNYGAEEKEGRRKHRKPLTEFASAAKIDAIVDPEIRRLVREKWEENGGDAKKFASNPPFMEARDGRLIPIKKARYWKTNTTVAVGRFKLEKQVGRALDEKKEEDRKLLRRLRYVETANNSHMEVYAVLDENEVVKEWKVDVVSRFDAYERKRQKEPVVRRDFGPGTAFLFTLALNEAIVFNGEKIAALAPDGGPLNDAIRQSGEKIYILRGGIRQSKQIEFREHKDGRKKVDSTTGLTKKDTVFLSSGLRKLRVDALGNVFWANE